MHATPFVARRQTVWAAFIWLSPLVLLASGVDGSRGLNNSALDGEFTPEVPELQSVAELTTGSKGEWLVAPIPSLSPGQGYGLQTIVARIYREKDALPSTPPSTLGVVALYTQEKSYALGLGYNGHLADDRWRVVAAGGYMRFNSDYYGVGNSLGALGLSIPLEQKATVGLAKVMRRIRPGLYLGLNALAARTTITAHGPSTPSLQLPDLVASADINSVGPVAQSDTRDNTFAPTRGSLIDAKVNIVGGRYHYRSSRLAANLYHPLGDRGVLAWRGYVQTTDGHAPFYALCSFGQGSDLRGYTSGRYRDRAMVAVQVEYRWQLSPRWGVVAFGGTGQVGPSLGSLSTERLLSSAGAGVRFRLSKNNPVNFRCDWAQGRDDNALYLGVGEAF
jgi:outer membrane protein assembly factor BamA